MNPFKGDGEPLGLNHEGIQDSHRHLADAQSLPGRRRRAGRGPVVVPSSVIVGVGMALGVAVTSIVAGVIVGGVIVIVGGVIVVVVIVVVDEVDVVIVVIVTVLQAARIVLIEFGQLLGGQGRGVAQLLTLCLALGSHGLVGVLRRLWHPALQALALGERELVALKESVAGDR